MKYSEDPSTTDREHRRRRRRRCCCIALGIILVVLLTLGIVILVLLLTVLRPKDPTTTLVSAKLTGISPRVSLPVLRVELNITVDLDLLVHNPNPAAFSHDAGTTVITYKSAQVGDATIAPGRIPPHGDTHMQISLTLEADRFANELSGIIADVTAGEMAIDSNTRIAGRVTFLGLFKHHAVSLSSCHVVIGIPALKVRSQECTESTKL